jgi:hypothetical protein
MLALQTRALDQHDKELQIKEAETQAKAADMAAKNELAARKLLVDAAAKSDTLDLQYAKLEQTGELGEQNAETKALQVGMMGRAQDQALLAKDRENAQREVDEMQAEHDANEIGDSGAATPHPSSSAPAAAAPPPPPPPPAAPPQPAAPVPPAEGQP